MAKKGHHWTDRIPSWHNVISCDDSFAERWKVAQLTISMWNSERDRIATKLHELHLEGFGIIDAAWKFHWLRVTFSNWNIDSLDDVAMLIIGGYEADPIIESASGVIGATDHIQARTELDDFLDCFDTLAHHDRGFDPLPQLMKRFPDAGDGRRVWRGHKPGSYSEFNRDEWKSHTRRELIDLCWFSMTNISGLLPPPRVDGAERNSFLDALGAAHAWYIRSRETNEPHIATSTPSVTDAEGAVEFSLAECCSALLCRETKCKTILEALGVTRPRHGKYLVNLSMLNHEQREGFEAVLVKRKSDREAKLNRISSRKLH